MTTLPDRSVIRAEFGALLSAQMTGTGKPLQEVFRYMPKDFGGKSPVALLGSAGTRRTPFTRGGARPGYLLDLWFFVRYAALDGAGKLQVNASGQPAWSELDSQNMLDVLEAQVRELIDNSQKGANWKAIEYNADSTAEVISVGDLSYRAELIPLRFETF